MSNLNRLVALVFLLACFVAPTTAQTRTEASEAGRPSPGAERGRGKAVQLLFEDARSVHLAWGFDLSTIRRFDAPGSTSVRLPGYGERPASPELSLPFRIEFVAIPEGVTPHLRAAGQRPPRSISLSSLAVVTRGGAGRAIGAGSGVLQRGLPSVSLGRTGYFRDQRFVEVWIRPVQVGEDGETLHVHDRLEATISWAGAEVKVERGRDPFLEPLYDQLFVNADQGRTFRAPRRGSGQGKSPRKGTTEEASLTEKFTQSFTSLSASAAEAEPAAATGPSVRVEVNQAGVVRIFHADLSAVAPDLASLDPQTFRLTYRDSELPIFVSGEEDHSFDAGDYIEWFGMPPDDVALEQITGPPETLFPVWQLRDFTDTNVYWIDSLAGSRQRAVTIDATPGSGFPVATSWPSVARFENSGLFQAFGDTDPWLSCPRLADSNSACSGSICCDAPDSNFVIDLPDLAGVSGDASVRLVMKGWIVGLHRVDAQLDGVPLNSSPIEWTGLFGIDQSFTVPNASLAATSTVNLRLPGNGTTQVDSVVVDFIEIGYQRLFQAVDEALIFATIGDSQQTFEVEGFVDPPTAWYDVSLKDPATGHPIARRLGGAETSAVSGGFRTRFELASESLPERQVVVASASAVLAPAALERVEQEPLCDPLVGADLVVIGHPDLIEPSTNPALSDYLQHRELQGLRTRVVNVREVFDQFSGGLPEVDAIRDFLACAYETWTAPPPSFVLLLGDGTSDYKNRRELSPHFNQVPAPVHTIEDAVFGYYSADDWYAAFRGDPLASESDFVPDVMLGRIAAGTLQEVDNALRKIVRYEQSPPGGDWRSRGLFVGGDGNSTGQDRDFEQANDAVAVWFESPFTSEKLYYSAPPYNGQDPQFRGLLLDALDRGSAVVNYVGHGNFTIWDGDILLQTSDVANLTNTDRLPVYINSTCLMGGYHLDITDSLGELLIESTPDTGAIAVVAPSGLSTISLDEQINQEIFGTLMGPQRARTLGQVVGAARLRLAGQGSILALQNLTLLGDPALRLVLPAPQPGSGLAATAGNLQVDLGWSPSPDALVVGYQVYRTASADPEVDDGSAYTRLTAQPVAELSFTDTGVTNTITYAYAVTSVDASGFESAFSNFNTTCGTSANDCVQATPFNPSPPEAPQGLSATDPGSGFRIDLEWLPNSEPDLTAYTVMWGTSPGTYPDRMDVGLDTSASIVGLENGEVYYFAVTATNSSDGFVPPGSIEPLDNESEPSAEVSGVPTLIQGIRPPAMIGNLRMVRDAVDPSSLTLSWSAPTEDIYGGATTVVGFQVHRSEALDFEPSVDTLIVTLPGNATSWTDVGAYDDARAFYYVVLAADGDGLLSSASRAHPTGTSDLRIEVERDPDTALPTGFIVLSWGAVSRDIEGRPTVVDRYEVYGASFPFSRGDITSAILIGEVQGLSLRTPLPESMFFYSILAVDRRGNRSPF